MIYYRHEHTDIELLMMFVRNYCRAGRPPLERLQESCGGEQNHFMKASCQLLNIARSASHHYKLPRGGSVEILRDLHVHRIIRRDEAPPDVADSPVY